MAIVMPHVAELYLDEEESNSIVEAVKAGMIAAGMVVTGDIPPYSLAAGIPAKAIRRIRIEDNKIKFEPI